MGAFFRHIFFHDPFSDFCMGTMYGAYEVNYKKDLSLVN